MQDTQFFMGHSVDKGVLKTFDKSGILEILTAVIFLKYYSTSAMSLLYECINTVIAVLISISSGMPNHAASIQLCVQKLRILIEDSDQNCKHFCIIDR